MNRHTGRHEILFRSAVQVHTHDNVGSRLKNSMMGFVHASMHQNSMNRRLKFKAKTFAIYETKIQVTKAYKIIWFYQLG